MNCLNCGHEVKKNYYGGYTHANKIVTGNGQDECAVIKSYAMHIGNPKYDQCKCTKPKGDIE